MGTHPIFESDFDCLTENVNTADTFLDWNKRRASILDDNPWLS